MGNRAHNVIRASSMSGPPTAQKRVRGEALLETTGYISSPFFLSASRRVTVHRRRCFKFTRADYVISKKESMKRALLFHRPQSQPARNSELIAE